jgi:hypothetical protein
MSEAKEFQDNLHELADQVERLVKQSGGDAVVLLKILRFLEGLHHDVRENHFQAALPIQRHRLYALLREMESEGGWPYIPRMQLREMISSEMQSAAIEEMDAF